MKVDPTEVRVTLAHVVPQRELWLHKNPKAKAWRPTSTTPFVPQGVPHFPTTSAMRSGVTGSITPRSQMIARISRAVVTSKAGL
jgi:hypothetical protein